LAAGPVHNPTGAAHTKREVRIMPKDSQPDNKKARMEKCNGQTPLTRENQNHNRNAKKKAIRNVDK
jgi:hypothetical protein